MVIILSLIIVGFVTWNLQVKWTKEYKEQYSAAKEAMATWAFAISVVTAIILLVCSLVILSQEITKEANIAELQESWYVKQQLVTDILTDDSDYVLPSTRVDAYAIAEEWNSWLGSRKKLHENFWIGAFYPIDYDCFEYISLPESAGLG